MGKNKVQPKLGSLPERECQAIVQRLKYGKMPRVDSKLGLLLRDVEAGLVQDLGGKPDTGQLIKIGLVLQHCVLVAGLPLFGPDGDTHPSYKWATERLERLLDGLYKAPGRGAATPPKSAASLVLEVQDATPKGKRS